MMTKRASKITLEGLAYRIDPNAKIGPPKNGAPQYSCRCPVHQGDGQSLKIGMGEGGAPVLNCMAYQCSNADILSAVGLSWADILPDNNVTPIAPRVIDRPVTNDNTPYAEAEYLKGSSDGEAIAAHPYFIAKFQRTMEDAFIDTGDVRVGKPGRMGGKQCLIVPRHSIETGAFVGAEFIARTGKGGKKGFGPHGVFFIGNPTISEYIVVSEGWATAVTACVALNVGCAAVLFGNTATKQKEIAAIVAKYTHATVVELYEGSDEGQREFEAHKRIHTPNGDINDYYEQGDEIPTAVERGEVVEEDWKAQYKCTLDEFLALEDSEWVVDNLIIKGMINAIIAEPGAGKTTVMEHIAIRLAKRNDLRVTYVNADISTGAAKDYAIRMHEAGVFDRIDYLVPDLRDGKSMRQIVADITERAAAGQSFADEIWIFDTLKKMTDVLNKSSGAKLYDMLRSMCGKGATVVLLGHTNKYADKETGLHVYEGTGDLKSDCDVLLYLDMDRKPGEKVDEWLLSTREEKCRGIREDITIKINGKTRQIEFLDGYIDIAQKRNNEKFALENDSTIEAIWLELGKGQVKSSDLLKALRVDHGISRRQAEKVLKKYTGERFILSKGMEKNAKFWSRNAQD